MKILTETSAHSKGLVVAALLLLAACGDETNTTIVNETLGISQLSKGETFPKCSKDNAGEMLFVADSGAVYICEESGWQNLSSKDTLVVSKTDTLVIRDTLVGLNGESCTAKNFPTGADTRFFAGRIPLGLF